MCLPRSFGFALSAMPMASATAAGDTVAVSEDAVLASLAANDAAPASVKAATSMATRNDMRDFASVEQGNAVLVATCVLNSITNASSISKKGDFTNDGVRLCRRR